MVTLIYINPLGKVRANRIAGAQCKTGTDSKESSTSKSTRALLVYSLKRDFYLVSKEESYAQLKAKTLSTVAARHAKSNYF
jgi:hypothetical protein